MTHYYSYSLFACFRSLFVVFTVWMYCSLSHLVETLDCSSMCTTKYLPFEQYFRYHGTPHQNVTVFGVQAHAEHSASMNLKQFHRCVTACLADAHKVIDQSVSLHNSFLIYTISLESSEFWCRYTPLKRCHQVLSDSSDCCIREQLCTESRSHHSTRCRWTLQWFRALHPNQLARHGRATKHILLSADVIHHFGVPFHLCFNLDGNLMEQVQW